MVVKVRGAYVKPHLTKGENLKNVTADWQCSAGFGDGHGHQNGNGHHGHGNGNGHGHHK